MVMFLLPVDPLVVENNTTPLDVLLLFPSTFTLVNVILSASLTKRTVGIAPVACCENVMYLFVPAPPGLPSMMMFLPPLKSIRAFALDIEPERLIILETAAAGRIVMVLVAVVGNVDLN